ncbi:MAG: hypothetical protein ACQGQO_08900 [Sphaerochaetaceae bacterium]
MKKPSIIKSVLIGIFMWIAWYLLVCLIAASVTGGNSTSGTMYAIAFAGFVGLVAIGYLQYILYKKKTEPKTENEETPIEPEKDNDTKKNKQQMIVIVLLIIIILVGVSTMVDYDKGQRASAAYDAYKSSQSN